MGSTTTRIVAASLILGAASTVGDFIWATWIPRHRAIYGLTHGTLLFLVMGLVLGWFTGRVGRGAVSGAAIGLAAAGSFYVLAPLTGYSVMFVAWFGLWMALGFTYSWLAGVRDRARAVLLRAVAGAVASGLAFYLVSGIWRPFNPVGWDYAWHFAAWTFAFAPGFAALLGTSSSRTST